MEVLNFTKQWIKTINGFILVFLLVLSIEIIVITKESDSRSNQITTTTTTTEPFTTETSEDFTGDGNVGFNEGDEFTLVMKYTSQLRDKIGRIVRNWEYTSSQTITIIEIFESKGEVKILDGFRGYETYERIYGNYHSALIKAFCEEYRPLFHYTDEFDVWEDDLSECIDELKSYGRLEGLEVSNSDVKKGKATLEYRIKGNDSYTGSENTVDYTLTFDYSIEFDTKQGVLKKFEHEITGKFDDGAVDKTTFIATLESDQRRSPVISGLGITETLLIFTITALVIIIRRKRNQQLN